MTRVWLPDSPDTVEPLKNLPDGIEVDVWTGGLTLPGTKDDVEFIVLPPGQKPGMLSEITSLPSLKVIQLTSAGAEHIRPYIPDRITRCHARGAHAHQELPPFHPCPGKTGVGLDPQRAG